MNPVATWLIAKSVLIEAIRRREIYVIVLVSTLMIGAVMTIDFFQIEGLTKFYREVSLKIMNVATALTVIVLAARQLPREFEQRTIYPLLAKPVSRMTFLLGKLLGVMFSAAFCFALFMTVFICGTLYLKGEVPWGLFGQYIYLQLVMMLLLATMAFWLSMFLNLDAAITLGAILFFTANSITAITTYLYDVADPAFKAVLVALTFILPQLTLFDLSEKATHAQQWDPLALSTMATITVYGLVYTGIFLGLTFIHFRRRPL